jgi:Family of unknown function (DUF6527)
MDIVRDNRRTNVKAIQINEWPQGSPAVGTCYKVDDSRLAFACPGCGDFSAIRVGFPKPSESPSWQMDSGDLDDVTHLYLSPSINCIGCCGWHGYLRDGVFLSI